MATTTRAYDPEFIRNAVELSYIRPSIGELARELNIRPELLYRWRSIYTKEGLKKPAILIQQDLELENRRLKKELEQARMERDILKKAVTIFSKPGGIDFR